MQLNRTPRLVLGLAVAAASLAASQTRAAVVAGPVVDSGHTYYLVSKNNWNDSEAEAISLGGHLATVNSAAENTFLVNTFVLNGHTGDPLWLGYDDAATEGTFVWSSGEIPGYTNWQPGEPNDSNGNEDYTALNWHFAQGTTADHGVWNDNPLNGTTGYGGTTDGPYFGIVEVASVPEPAAAALLLAAAPIALRRARRR